MNLPSPWEIFTDPISLILIAIYVIFFIWESVQPGSSLPQVKYWKIKGILFFLFYFLLSTYLPLLWDGFFASHSIFDLSGAGIGTQTVLGVLIFEFLVWVWHYALHKSNFLWRAFHQLHHSAERVDIPGANYFHWTDMVGWTFIGTISMVWLVGLSPQSATYALIITYFLGTFQHANIKTPQWLGYIIQRPESHSVHHQKGVHAYNYSDLPLFDILFGTFKNPKEFVEETGFYEGGSDRMMDMLMFKDINTSGTESAD
jgi:sterol desaturase/sphingolipid hydroxylase (fatty acid hydroxylase superfamily)